MTDLALTRTRRRRLKLPHRDHMLHVYIGGGYVVSGVHRAAEQIAAGEQFFSITLAFNLGSLALACLLVSNNTRSRVIGGAIVGVLVGAGLPGNALLPVLFWQLSAVAAMVYLSFTGRWRDL